MNRKLSLGLVAVLTASLALTASPASAYGGSKPTGSIVDVAVAASGGGTPDANGRDYDLLVQALVATGLDATLADTSTTFTVFAPNDEAFLRLVTDLTGAAPASEAAALTAITSTFSAEQISNILLYHVVPGKKLGPLQVLLSRNLTMANGGTVQPRGTTLRDETPSLKDPRLVLRAINIQATNGVIHTIDRVLVPGA
ncbi:fasciclin domain-containing protein [Microbacterium sp. Sa4CUA7]|uniref:Fasciclin domain-containing protein n=1 Tax=Microbacterium pullorum TaxID=2762236 RepID=A0ABR8S4L6_9MICO|nr:fasciclin domain-containing protein [Microbacterium pullorum]MBD7958411.1 fasciclin domain-containing protein [Microbacterium pullorum]